MRRGSARRRTFRRDTGTASRGRRTTPVDTTPAQCACQARCPSSSCRCRREATSWCPAGSTGHFLHLPPRQRRAPHMCKQLQPASLEQRWVDAKRASQHQQQTAIGPRRPPPHWVCWRDTGLACGHPHAQAMHANSSERQAGGGRTANDLRSVDGARRALIAAWALVRAQVRGQAERRAVATARALQAGR
jgi:hypothetical protein